MVGLMVQRQAMPHARRVLLVEDNLEARQITGATLRHVGYDVVEADSIAAANAAAAGSKPDVVLLDCRLPDGDGLELVRVWRDDPRMRDVSVVVLTAFYARQDMEAALLAGVDAFLVKPCPANVLAMQIERVLSGQRPSASMRKI
jgi:putative two-component system response regulator